MKLSLKLFLLIMPLLLPVLSPAQTTTRNDGDKSNDPNLSKKAKVLVIPWDEHMFNCSSDITRSISNETSQKYNQIEEAFRRGMVEQIKHAFGSSYSVVSLLDDTAKMKADLHYVYTCTSLSYTPVNFPLNPTKADSAKLKTQSGIQKGQVAVSSDDADKFMNTIVLSPNLLGYLKKKYGVEYVVFINELDMDNDLGADPYNKQEKQVFNRSVIAHWTIFRTSDGKRVAMGKNKSTFTSTTNSPKKISDSAFSVIAKAMYEKFAAAVKPKQ